MYFELLLKAKIYCHQTLLYCYQLCSAKESLTKLNFGFAVEKDKEPIYLHTLIFCKCLQIVNLYRNHGFEYPA